MQRELLRSCLHNLDDFGHVGVAANRVFNVVIALAQTGIYILQQPCIFLGICGLNLLVLGIRFQIGGQDFQNTVLVGYVVGVEICFQTLEVGGVIGSGDEALGELIQILNILFKSGGTAFGQTYVILIRAFG